MLSPNVRASLLFDLIYSNLRSLVESKNGFDLALVNSDYFQRSRHVDAAAIFKVLDSQTSLFTEIDRRHYRDMRDAAQFLYNHRQAWAHQKGISEEESKYALQHAAKLFRCLGLESAARNAESLAPVREDTDLHRLKTCLLERALPKARPLTYAECLAQLGWDDIEARRSHLIRLLNGLGGWQKALGEPILSALVVLADDEQKVDQPAGLPGRGFYWLIDIERNATPSVKRSAWERELRRLQDFRW